MKFKFPDSDSDLWYLYHIGPLFKEDDKIKVNFYFANTLLINDHFNENKDNWEVKFILKAKAENLYSLTIGCIYDAKKGRIITPNKYVAKSVNIIIDHVPNYNTTSKPIPFIDSKYYLLDNQLPLDNYRHFKYKSEYYSSDIMVFANTYMFYRRFLFMSENLITTLLEKDIEEIFTFSSVERVENKSKNCYEGFVNYDSNLLSFNEAKFLACYFFLDADLKIGKSFLNYIQGYFKSNLFNKKNSNKESTSSYLDIKLPFSDDVKLKFIGKYLENRDNKKRYFYCYDIDHISYGDGSSPFNVESVILTDVGDVKPTKKQGSENSLLIRSNRLSNPSHIGTITSKPSNVFSDSLNISKEDNLSFFNHINFMETTSDYEPGDIDNSNVKVIKEAAQGLTDNIDYQDEDSEFKPINPVSSQLEIINHFEYIHKIARFLNSEYQITFSFDNLHLPISNYSSYKILGYEVVVVNLICNSDNFYLLEFHSGNTGFFYNQNKSKISKESLTEFLIECIDKIQFRPKGRQVWSWLVESMKSLAESKSIIMSSGIDHCQKDRNVDLIISDNANRIYNDRILKAS